MHEPAGDPDPMDFTGQSECDVDLKANTGSRSRTRFRSATVPDPSSYPVIPLASSSSPKEISEPFRPSVLKVGTSPFDPSAYCYYIFAPNVCWIPHLSFSGEHTLNQPHGLVFLPREFSDRPHI